MTIKVETGKSEIYAGPYTVGTVLGIPFTFLKPEHIHVLRNATELSPTSEFIVEGDSIRLLIPIASNETVTIYRSTPVDNDADFPQESKFPSEKIADAIDKQAAEEGEQYFTNERQNAHKALSAPLDFDALIAEFNGIIDKLIAADEAKFGEYWAPRITEIVERYLGKGIKVNDCSREQVEALDLILSDLKELL